MIPEAAPVAWRQSADYVGGTDWSEEEASNYLVQDLDAEYPFDVSIQDREVVKDVIVQSLSDASGLPYEDVNKIVAQWAQTSGDGDMRSLAMQFDAAKEFDVPVSDWTKGQLEELQAKITARGGVGPGARSFWSRMASEEDQRKLLRVMYDQTQAEFAEQGLAGTDTVRLFRGVAFPPDVAPAWKPDQVVNIATNAMSSWTSEEGTEGRFAVDIDIFGEEFGAILEMEVPVSRILSTARTGFGCITESEYLVLGNAEDWVRVVETTEEFR